MKLIGTQKTYRKAGKDFLIQAFEKHGAKYRARAWWEGSAIEVWVVMPGNPMPLYKAVYEGGNLYNRLLNTINNF